MKILQLQISNIRNLESVQLDLVPGLNFIWGNNGAGKTSVLESIYLAARGRSFRQRDISTIIRSGQETCRVVTRLEDQHVKKSVLGVERSRTAFRARLNHQDIYKRSILAKALPLQVITPNSHELIERGPESRRRFLDMGLFHVEHQYHPLVSDYLRVLHQRNAGLRQSIAVAQHWDQSLAELALRINSYRMDYVERFSVETRQHLTAFDSEIPIKIELRPGWDLQSDLIDLLGQKIEQDARAGYTRLGPHRADLKITSAGVPADKCLSRGQQKLVVYALHLAQAEIQRAMTGEAPILLIDDLPAELDSSHYSLVRDHIGNMSMQVIMTGVDPMAGGPEENMGLFHVEHGCLGENQGIITD